MKKFFIIFFFLVFVSNSYGKISSVIKKGVFRGCIDYAKPKNSDQAKNYCNCTINVIDNNMTTEEYMTLESAEKKNPGTAIHHPVIIKAASICLDKFYP